MVEIPQTVTKDFKQGLLFSTFLKTYNYIPIHRYVCVCVCVCVRVYLSRIVVFKPAYVSKLSGVYEKIQIVRCLSRRHDFKQSRLGKFIF